MAVTRRPLGQMRGEPGRPPMERAGPAAMGMGGPPPPMDTAPPRHLAPAMGGGIPGVPEGVPGAPGMDAGMGMGGSDLVTQLMALLQGRR